MKTPKRFTQRPRRKRKERSAPKRQRSIQRPRRNARNEARPSANVPFQRQRPKRKEQGVAGALKRLGPRPSTGSPSAPDDPRFLEFWHRAKGTLPETIGEADLSTLNSALGFLFDRLRQARARFEQEGDSDRQSVFSALGAFWSFITLFGGPFAENLHVPIMRLQDALWMLDHGETKPMLKPMRRPRGGRAPSSQTYASLRGHAAATVQLLRQAGLALDDAHRAVARQLSQDGVLPERGSGTLTATTVRNWCDEVSSDFGRLGPAAWMYDYKLARGKEMLSGLSKSQARQAALEELTYWIRTLLPELQKPT
jgi:hypothetical protein